ncbi:MAG: type 4a pilus biogenesis protein PilO [Patescibacteria group bacterium]
MKALTPIICLLIAGAVLYLYVKPGYEKLNVLRDTTKQYEAAVARAKQVGLKRDDLARKYNAFDDNNVARLQKLLPDRIDSIKLIVDINSMVNKYGASVKSIKPGDDKGENKPYGSVSLSFSTTMSYDNFLLFLEDLQKNLRLTDVTDINFKATETGLYDYNITIKNYWLK